MERYFCKECGAKATVSADGSIHRTCEHMTTIILDITVTCRGEGGMQDDSRLRKLVNGIISLLHWRKA